MTNAIISNIQKFSVHDGPGIRSTVFMKGCPLNCLWCANPENICPKKQISYSRTKCICCGLCVNACPADAVKMEEDGVSFNRDLCIGCGNCAEACCTEACRITGREYSVEELIEIIDKDISFYTESDGGVTFSGGEPLMNPAFVQEVAEHYKSIGLSTAVETCGFVPWENIEKVKPFIDLFLYDLKFMDPKKHSRYCGASNELIIDNLMKLKDVRIIIRIPLIPGINDTDEDLKAAGEFLKKIENRIEGVHCLPYHNFGVSKYDSLGMKYSLEELEAPEKEYVQQKADVIKRYVEKVQIGG